MFFLEIYVKFTGASTQNIGFGQQFMQVEGYIS